MQGVTGSIPVRTSSFSTLQRVRPFDRELSLQCVHVAKRMLLVLLAGRCATYLVSITMVKGAFGAGTPLSRQWYPAHCLARSMQRARVRAVCCDGGRADSLEPHFWQDAARDLLHVRQRSWALSASKSQGTWGMAPSANF